MLCMCCCTVYGVCFHVGDLGVKISSEILTHTILVTRFYDEEQLEKKLSNFFNEFCSNYFYPADFGEKFTLEGRVRSLPLLRLRQSKKKKYSKKSRT